MLTLNTQGSFLPPLCIKSLYLVVKEIQTRYFSGRHQGSVLIKRNKETKTASKFSIHAGGEVSSSVSGLV